jgi:hypothetical protein
VAIRRRRSGRPSGMSHGRGLETYNIISDSKICASNVIGTYGYISAKSLTRPPKVEIACLGGRGVRKGGAIA